MDLEDITMGQMMTTGRIEHCRFSPELVAILAKATTNEKMEMDLELNRLEDDGQEHYFMPEDKDHVPVVQWSESEDSNEPGEWSIFMFRDPITQSNRMVAWICDGHCWVYLRKII